MIYSLLARLKASTTFQFVQSFLIIRAIPQSIFLTCYRKGIFQLYRFTEYKYPKLHSLNFLGVDTTQSSQYCYQRIVSARSYESKNEDVFYNNPRYKFNNATIVYPSDWLSTENFEFQTHGLQIKFLSEGLIKNGFQVHTIDEDMIDNSRLSSQLASSDLIVFWSLSSLQLESNTMITLRKLNKFNDAKTKFVGVISASPGQKLIEKYKAWNELLDGVVYYEEISDFRDQLSDIFKVYHSPLIQFSNLPKTVPSNPINLHFSGTLKYNRRDWLIAARAASVKLKIPYKFRLIAENKAKRNTPFVNYKSEERISRERQRFSLGLNLAYREPGRDAHLIGSFWDFYRMACVPIVVGHQSKLISSYLSPFVDYFPVEKEEELYDVLSYSKMNPEKIFQMRKKILSRMQNEFTPFNVTRKLLSELNFPINKTTL